MKITHTVSLSTGTANRNIAITLIMLVVLAGIIGASSCKRGEYVDELNKIDSLIVINDSVGLMLSGIDTVLLLASRETFAEHWKVIKGIVDSINDAERVRGDDYWNFITLYESSDRALKKLYRRYNRLAMSQRENREQLRTLFESVKRNQIPADSTGIYIAVEGLAVLAVQKETQMYMPELAETLHTLDSLHQYAPEAIARYRKPHDARSRR